MFNDDLRTVSLEQLMHMQNWQAKYRLITQWALLIQPKPALRVEQNLVKGCETSAWMNHQRNAEGRYRFAFDSDSRVIKGLAALLLSMINNKTAAELSTLDFEHVLRDAGLETHMTPSRNNGFRSIVLRINELIAAANE